MTTLKKKDDKEPFARLVRCDKKVKGIWEVREIGCKSTSGGSFECAIETDKWKASNVICLEIRGSQYGIRKPAHFVGSAFNKENDIVCKYQPISPKASPRRAKIKCAEEDVLNDQKEAIKKRAVCKKSGFNVGF